MASLFRNSRVMMTRLSCMHRTATTAAVSSTGTQVKTTGATATTSQASRHHNETNMAVRDSRQNRSSIADAIKPRAAGEPAFIPLVGTALNTWGQIGFGVVLALSAYFIYINYITNPEFYKSLKISREASKRGSHEQPANREGSIGHKIDDANAPKGALNKHL